MRERAREGRFALGREAGDDIGAERHVGPRGAQARGDGVRVRDAVAPLHAREDQVVAGLQAEMDVRHQPRIAEALDQPVVDLGRIERRETQPLEVRKPIEQGRHQVAES